MSSMSMQKFKLNKGNRNLKVENKLLKLADLQISWQIFRICEITVSNHWIIYLHYTIDENSIGPPKIEFLNVIKNFEFPIMRDQYKTFTYCFL